MNNPNLNKLTEKLRRAEVAVLQAQGYRDGLKLALEMLHDTLYPEPQAQQERKA